jgi:hypothetical protein
MIRRADFIIDLQLLKATYNEYDKTCDDHYGSDTGYDTPQFIDG